MYQTIQSKEFFLNIYTWPLSIIFSTIKKLSMSYVLNNYSFKTRSLSI